MSGCHNADEGVWISGDQTENYMQCVIVVFPDHTHLIFEIMDIEIIIPLSNFRNNVQDVESNLYG